MTAANASNASRTSGLCLKADIDKRGVEVGDFNDLKKVEMPGCLGERGGADAPPFSFDDGMRSLEDEAGIGVRVSEVAALKGEASDALDSGTPCISRVLFPIRELLRALTILDAKLSSFEVRPGGGEDEISSGEMFWSSSSGCSWFSARERPSSREAGAFCCFFACLLLISFADCVIGARLFPEIMWVTKY